MKRPDNFDTVSEVKLAYRRSVWHPVVEAMGPGVRVVVDGATHWYLWDKVRDVRGT